MGKAHEFDKAFDDGEDIDAHVDWPRARRVNVETKRAKFAETMKRLRPLTEGRKHTPAEVLIREDRDRGHRDDF